LKKPAKLRTGYEGNQLRRCETGSGEEVAHLVRRLTEVGIPVMGHIGVTPQSAKLMGYGKRGKDISDAEYLKRSAKALYEAGAFSLVLENMAATLVRK